MSSPRVFGLPHLSEDAVAAFADGVLSASAAGRARRHCAECPECADAVRIQREAAMLLRTAPAPALPSGLLDRLAGLPMSTPLPPPRGGLPTVLGADGTPLFVAHDVHRAASAQSDERRRSDGERPAGRRPDGEPHPGQRDAGHLGQQHPNAPAGGPSRRRGTLPATMLASAAAVVAAGTFGGHVSSLAASGDGPTPASAAQVAGALAGNRAAAPNTGNLTADRSTLLGTGPVLDTGLQTAGLAGVRAQPVVRPGVPLPASVTVARVPRHPGSLSVLPALLAGHGPTAAGTPTATP